MDIRTTRLGTLETVPVPDTAVLTFPEGLPGFEDHHAFALIEDQTLEPFHWLQSLADPNVGFLVIEPAALVPDYAFDLPDPDVRLLELDGTNPPRVLCILTVPGDVQAMTANLQAPLVINPRRQLGKQVILTDEGYPLRHPVFGPSDSPDGGQGEAGGC
jgi:flagellar assembly factor FliW